jgi:hypothetical protein
MSEANSVAKQILASLILLTALAACSGHSVVVEPPTDAILNLEKAEAPEYKGGGSWIYRVVDKMHEGYRSDLLNGDFEIAFRGGRPWVLQLDGDKKIDVAHPGSLRMMVPAPRVVRGPLQFFNFPIWVGKKWTVKYLAGSRWRTAENTVTGIETVTTTAGAFRAFRIEREIRFITEGRGEFPTRYHNTWTFSYFYCPQTRSVVKYAFKAEQKEGISTILTLIRTTDIELIEYIPGKRSPAGVAFSSSLLDLPW